MARMGSLIVSVVLICCLASLAAAKHTLHVDNIFPATNDFVRVNHAVVQNAQVAELDVGALNVKSLDGFQAESSDDIELQGAFINFDSTDSINFNGGEDSTANVRAGPVLNFKNDDFQVDSADDIFLESRGGMLKFVSTDDINGSFDDTMDFSGTADFEIQSFEGNIRVAVSNTANIRSAVSKVFATNGYTVDVPEGELEISAQQTLDTLAIGTAIRAQDQLSVQVTRNNLLFDASETINGNFNSLNIAGEEYILLGSPQGSVNLQSFSDDVRTSSASLLLRSHRGITASATGSDINLSATGNINVNADHGAVLEALTGDVTFDSQNFRVISRRLVLNHDGDLVFGTQTINIGGGDTLSITSDGTTTFTATNNNVVIDGDNGVYINSGDEIFIGRTAVAGSGSPNAPLVFDTDSSFTLSGARSTAIQSSSLSIPSSTNIRLKNDYDPSNVFSLTSTTTFTATAADDLFIQGILQFTSTTLDIRSTATDILVGPVNSVFPDPTLTPNTLSFVSNFIPVTSQTTTLTGGKTDVVSSNGPLQIYGQNSFSLNAGLTPATLSFLAETSITLDSQDSITFSASNFKEFSTTLLFTSPTFSLDTQSANFVTQNDFTWTAGTTWNTEWDTALTFTALQSFEARALNGDINVGDSPALIRFLGDWDFIAPLQDIQFNYDSYYWQTDNYQDISILPDNRFEVDARDLIEFHSRDLSISTPSFTSNSGDSLTITSEYEKDLKMTGSVNMTLEVGSDFTVTSSRDIIFRATDMLVEQGDDSYTTNRFVIRSPRSLFTTNDNVNLNSNAAFNITTDISLIVDTQNILLQANKDTKGAYFGAKLVTFEADEFEVTSAESIDITTNINDITISSTNSNTLTTTTFSITGGDIEVISNEITINAPTATFVSRISDIEFFSNVETTIDSPDITISAFNNLFKTSQNLDFNAIQNLAANAESVDVISGPLTLTARDLVVNSNNDVELNAANGFSITASAANVDTNAIKIFSTSQDAGIVFSSTTNMIVEADQEIQINAGDLSRGGSDVSITSSSGTVLFSTQDPDPTYSVGAIFSSGGARFDWPLGVPYGQLYRAQAADITLTSQGGSTNYEAPVGDLTVNGNAGFSLFSEDAGTIAVTGTTEANVSGFIAFNSGNTIDILGPSDVKLRSDERIAMTAGNQYTAGALNDILISTEDGSVSFSIESGPIGIVSNKDTDLRATEKVTFQNVGTLADFTLTASSIAAFDAEKGFTLSASSALPAGTATIQSRLLNLRSSTNGDVSVSSGSFTETVSGSQDIYTGSGFELSAGLEVSFESLASEIIFSNSGSFEAFALARVNILSESGQQFTADNAIRVSPQNQLSVLDAVVNIFAGGDSITQGVRGNIQGDVTITTLDAQVKYTAETFSQYAKTTSSYQVTGGPIQFQATGTPGLANLITIASADTLVLGGVDVTFGQSQFIDLQALNELTVNANNNIELDSARLFNLDAERELQVNAGAFWTMSALGKMTYSTFDDTRVDGTTRLSFLADTTSVFQSKGQMDVIQLSVSFGQTISTLGTNAGITFSTLSGDSRIALEPLSSSLNMEAQNGKITYNVEFQSVFRAPTQNINIDSADEARFTAGRVLDYSVGTNLDLTAADDMEITSKEPSTIIFGTQGNAAFFVTSGSAAIQPDNDFILNSRIVSFTNNANAFLESGSDFIVQTTASSSISSQSRVDFVTRGNALFSEDTSADERFGMRFGGNSITATSSKNVNFESQDSILVNSGSKTTFAITEQLAFTSNGTRGIQVSSLHDNYFRAASTLAVNSLSGETAFVTLGQDAPNGFQSFDSTGPIEFTSANLVSFDSAGGVSILSPISSLVTSTKGSMTFNAAGRKTTDAAMEFISLGYINFFSNNGSVGMAADQIEFNVDARSAAISAYDVSRFSTLSIEESGVQASEIQMVAFGSNEEGNGIQISSYDPNTDIIISAEQRSVVTFDSGAVLSFEGAHGAELAAFDDQIVTSFGPINIAGAGRSFIDDRDSSIELVATNPEGQDNLGSNIEFISHDNVTMFTVDVLLNEAAQLLVFEGGDLATFLIQSSTGFNIDSPNQSFSASSGGNFLIGGNTVRISSFTGLNSFAGNTIQFTTGDEFIVQASPYSIDVSLQAIFFAAPLIDVNTDIFEISNDADLVIDPRGPSCANVHTLTVQTNAVTICTSAGFRSLSLSSNI